MARYFFKTYRRHQLGGTAGKLDGKWDVDASSEVEAENHFKDRVATLDLKTHFAVMADEKDDFVRFWLEGKCNA